MTPVEKLVIIIVWALIIIAGELLTFWRRKRIFLRGQPTVALIIRKDFSSEDVSNKGVSKKSTDRL